MARHRSLGNASSGIRSRAPRVDRSHAFIWLLAHRSVRPASHRPRGGPGHNTACSMRKVRLIVRSVPVRTGGPLRRAYAGGRPHGDGRALSATTAHWPAGYADRAGLRVALGGCTRQESLKRAHTEVHYVSRERLMSDPTMDIARIPRRKLAEASQNGWCRVREAKATRAVGSEKQRPVWRGIKFDVFVHFGRFSVDFRA